MDSVLVDGDVTGGVAAASASWFIFLKKGFLVSVPYEGGVGAGGGLFGISGSRVAGAGGGSDA